MRCVPTGQRCSTTAAGSTPCCAPSARCVPASAASGAPTVCAVPPTNPIGPAAIISSRRPTLWNTVTVKLAPAASSGGSTAGVHYRVTLTQLTAAARPTAITVTKAQANRALTFVTGGRAEGAMGQ